MAIEELEGIIQEEEDLQIRTRGLTKYFGRHLALRGIDLQVPKNQRLTLFGTNGAGKTTLLKILATLLKPSSGTVEVAGWDIQDHSVDIRKSIGVVSHHTMLYDDLTAYENLKYYGRMYGIPDTEERIRDVLDKVGLSSRVHDRARTLSRGMQQRLSIARALMHNPEIMLLDEPETGLDQHATLMLGEMLDISGYSERTTIMSSHNLERGFDLADRIVILNRGSIVFDERKGSVDLVDVQESYSQYSGAIR
ncbi:MAG: ABC transporter ATP-binding protein [Chloroflexota bacterium]|nr:ABC transporter ATP-binding protein [Chloroflexota bacterium]